MINFAPWREYENPAPQYSNLARSRLRMEMYLLLRTMAEGLKYPDLKEHPTRYVNSAADPEHFMDTRLPMRIVMRMLGRELGRRQNERLLGVLARGC